jgi:hypothetical protein
MPVTLPSNPFGVLRAAAGTGVGLGGGADSVIKAGLEVGVGSAVGSLLEDFVACSGGAESLTHS